MGGLAPGLDLLDEPITELRPDLPAMDEAGHEDSKFDDLPLWYSTLVAPQSRFVRLGGPRESPPARPLFWRPTVARWPIERRQAWGDLANALQDAGLGWKDAELKAFEQIVSCLKPMPA